MKATGVVRRIDELGRIVIPKELRKILRIKEGENVEIYTIDEEKIVLKKFSSIKNISDMASYVTETIYSMCKLNTLIYDHDSVIAYAGKGKKDYIEKKIGLTLEELLANKKVSDIKEIVANKEENVNIVNSLIKQNGDIVGGILVMSSDEMDEKLLYALNGFSIFLEKYLD